MAENRGFFKLRETFWYPLKRGTWCPEEDSNLHGLATAST